MILIFPKSPTCLQITLQQNLQTLEDVSKDRDDTKQKFDKTKSKLDEATTKLDSQQTELDQSNQRYKELSTNLQHTKETLDKEVGKWKLLYDSLYNQYDNELHTWEENLSKLETQRDERETAYAEETRRKDRVVSDLSDQLKESEDRIQELQIELEACKVSHFLTFPACFSIPIFFSCLITTFFFLSTFIIYLFFLITTTQIL